MCIFMAKLLTEIAVQVGNSICSVSGNVVM